jgi:tubulin monoglycylase TTLL15
MAKAREKLKTSKNPTFSFKQLFMWVLTISVVLLAVLAFKFLNFQVAKITEMLSKSRPPKYWHVCTASWNRNGHLRTMDRVFNRLGFEFVNASEGDDWDVLWGFEYPFDHATTLFDPLFNQPWKDHQRINHIPGNGHITVKGIMTTENQDLDFIMPTFDERELFEKYVEKNPDKKFVQKNIYDRGVKVIEKNEIDFSVEDKIYQVFMDKPMLIDGRAFDMGVYALISSVNPLRVYRYESEMLMRFCPDPYYPFNASNVDQYVIYESHQQYDQLPSFQKYNKKLGYSLKHIFEDYLRENGHNPADLWKQVDEIMATMISRTEKKFMYWVRRHSSSLKLKSLTPLVLAQRTYERQIHSTLL